MGIDDRSPRTVLGGVLEMGRRRLLVSIRVSLVVAYGVTLGLPGSTLAEDTVANTNVGELDVALALESAFVRAIERSEHSVVAIARGRRGDRTKLQDPQFIPHEYCAGVIVDSEGLILTNYHSLGKVSENDYVVWHQRRAYADVKVLAADPWSDLAILEIKARDLTPIQFADAQGLKKGRIVISLGNPYAIARDGDVSATWGIVSNIGRKVDGPLSGSSSPERVDPRRRETLYHYGGLIQTDAKLAKNTSGGPLLDLSGRMIGLSTSIAVLAGFEKGTGYAIPVDDRFRATLAKLQKGEEIENGFLGVAPRNPVPQQGEVGVILERVELGTPAALGGLSSFDEVVRIDDAEIRSVDDLFFKVGATPPGEIVNVTLRSSGGLFPDRTVTKPIRLTKKPNTATRPIIATAPKRHWRGMQVDYGTAVSLSRLTALAPEGCVIATAVEQDSAAWQAGLRTGTVVCQVDGVPVQAPDEFFAAIEEKESDVVSLTLFEQGKRRTVEVAVDATDDAEAGNAVVDDVGSP